ncbi:hypothetical protein [Mycobacterium sp.]|uniref:hypothetical protein n=1 Tax=Mycobacterium sp. TaxID=1785 RepID=UPI003C754DB8
MANFATELSGLAGRDTDTDTDAAQWIIRVVLSLLFWPIGDDDVENQMLERFVALGFTEQG